MPLDVHRSLGEWQQRGLVAARRWGGDMAWVEKGPPGGTVVYELDSPVVGDRLAITVSVPPGPLGDADLLPTIYVLDPVPLLDTVVGCARTLAMWGSGHFPRTLVVGVGYPTQETDDIISRRQRDLTPTEVPFPPRTPSPSAHGRGKAAAFLRSLREEIIPEIEARYRVHPTDRTLVGWSYGGLFGLYTLLHQPETFARYLLASPSIWYGGAVSFDDEQEWAARHDDLDAKVFLAVGEREQMPGRHWPPEFMSTRLTEAVQMVSNVEAMARRLDARHYPSLTLNHAVFADEHHASAIPAAVSRGLLTLFVPPEDRFFPSAQGDGEPGEA